MLSLSVVIPTYNERENIVILIPELVRLLAPRRLEIIVVDDQSPDGTGAAVQALALGTPGLQLIVKTPREGIGAALRRGYNEARHDVIASLDADLSYDTRDLLKLLDRIEAGADLVVGSRHMAGGAYATPSLRVRLKYVASSLGNRFTRWVSGLEVHDVSANFRAIRRGAWQAIQTWENTNSLLFEMIIKAHRGGFRVEEVPISFGDRIHGESKLNLIVELPKFLVKLFKYSFLHRR